MRSLQQSLEARPQPGHGNFYIPEELTALYYAPIYNTLSLDQRTRYNQLFGLFLNEFVLLCELHFSKAYLSLLKAPHLSEARKAEIRRFLQDEERHTRLFTSLNQEAAPELYVDSGFYFIELPWLLHIVAGGMMRFPKLFPFFFVLVYLQEEKLLYYAERYAACAENVDARFLAAHATHLEDEKGHIGLDLSVVAELWQRASQPVKRLNGWLLQTIFREFFTAPKRSGMRILERLIAEFPELTQQREELRTQLSAAGMSQGFLDQMYSEHSVPGSLRFFDTHPELRSLTQVGR